MSMITVRFHGHEFDPLDPEIRIERSKQRALEMAAGQMDQLHDTLVRVLTGIISYHLLSAATLVMARGANLTGLSLGQALSQHNYIGELIGELPLDLQLEPEPEEIPQIVLPDAEG